MISTTPPGLPSRTTSFQKRYGSGMWWTRLFDTTASKLWSGSGRNGRPGGGRGRGGGRGNAAGPAAEIDHGTADGLGEARAEAIHEALVDLDEVRPSVGDGLGLVGHQLGAGATG